MMRWKLTYLLLCIGLLLAGCAGNATLESTTHSTPTTELLVPTGNYSDAMSIKAGTGFHDYDEYKEFIGSNPLPKGFVSYDSLSHFGVFRGFTCSYFDGRYETNRHYYTVVDSTGLAFAIGVLPDNETPLLSSVTAVPDLSDMRRLGSNETGVYRYGDVIYQYHSGEIYCIKWQIDDVMLYLRPQHSEMVDGYYPYVETTVFGKLMNIQDKTPEEVMQLVLNG